VFVTFFFKKKQQPLFDLYSVFSRYYPPLSCVVLFIIFSDRFRILSPTTGSSTQERHAYTNGQSPVPLYNVQRLRDTNLPLPPASLRRVFQSSKNLAVGGSGGGLNHMDQTMNNLSLVSQVPAFVLKRFWPWKLIQKIQDTVIRIYGTDEALRYNLLGEKDFSGDVFLNRPLQYSFMLASNLPLSISDKLSLLAMNCILGRLEFVHNKLIELQEKRKLIICTMCDLEMSNVSSLFTVGGAEGTTGAYGEKDKNNLSLIGGVFFA